MTGMIQRDDDKAGQAGQAGQAGPAAPQALGDYLLLERIGEGPVGVSYRGLDQRDGARVVVRLAGPAAGDGAALRREAKLLAGLRHPNLVRLLEAGERDGRAYLVLGEEDGITLERLPAAWRASMGQRALLELLAPLLSALEAVHEAGVLHGDISPRNILLRRDGTPLLLDFASAVARNEAAAGEERAAATPGFAAPERGDPAREGPGSDLFALAAVAYWLIVGEPLELAADGAAFAGAAFSGAVGGDKRFSASFARAVDAALAPAIEDRPASAAQWRRALLDAGPAERADAPSLAELSGATREAAEIDLPPADEVSATVLLPPRERPQSGAAAGDIAGGTAALTSDRAATLRGARRRGAPRAALALLLVVLAGGGAAAGWWGWTWYRDAAKQAWLVDAAGGGDAASLGEALARAPDGATISIRPGVYAESLVIARPVHLKALATEDGGEVVIHPDGGWCLRLRAPSGSLEGLAFEGGDGAGSCLVIESGAMEIVGNRLGPWAGSAMTVRDGAAPLIRDNRFLDIGGSAVVFDDGGGGVAEGNEIVGTVKSAIRASAGADPTVRGNEISGAGQAGLLIEQGAQGGYEDNRIAGSQASGIEVRAGAAPRVAANLIEDAGQAGLFIHEGAKGEFLDNRILRSKLSGIVVTGGAAPLVTGNEVAESAQHGLLILGGAGGRFADNRIHGNQGHGVVLGGGQAAELEDNELADNRAPQVRRIAQ